MTGVRHSEKACKKKRHYCEWPLGEITGTLLFSNLFFLYLSGKFKFVTLTIQDSKPLVEFFVKLENIISHFENKPIYQHFEQITLGEIIP